MLNKKVLKNIRIFASCLGLLLAGCTHESQVKPSTGHINGDTKQATKPAIAQPANQNTQNVQGANAAIPKLVKPPVSLPPPKLSKPAPTYSVVVNEVPVKEILFALARESKINVDIHPGIKGRATLNAVDQTLPQILERLAKQVDLSYRVEGNTLFISPDLPLLRTYKIDYVNMSRDTKGFIGAASEISSTGQTANSNGSGQTTITNTSGNGANNSSRTSVSTESKNHLWESLIQNIRDLLAETDKEVLVARNGTADQVTNNKKNKTTIKVSVDNQDNQNKEDALEDLDRDRAEYKTLFAANVIANPETGVVSVRATNRQHQKVQEFIDKVMHSARKQVLIEATIVEVQLNDSFQAGIDWSRLNNPGNSGFTFRQQLGSQVNVNAINGRISTTGNAFGAIPNAGFVAGYLNPISRIGNIAASINLLEQFGDTKVLSSPKLMVLNNQTAVLKVVDNIVYFTVQSQQTQGAIGGGTLSTVTTTPNTVPVGVVMSVTPQINDAGNVNVNVRPTVSRVIGFKSDPNPNLSVESLVPEIQVREMESMLQIDSGLTAVLGGLMQDEIRRNTDRVPGVGKLPVVGKVFTGKNDATKKTELVIFLRPTVIGNPSLESEELRSFKEFLPARQLEKVLEDAQ